MFRQLSKQYSLCLKIYVQTNNSAHNIHYVSLKYTFNTNRGMSTLHSLPTWLVPEARWQRTGILSRRPVHRIARVNTTAKNKYLFQEYSPQPLAARGKKINCSKTDKLLIFNVVYARSLNVRTTHTPIHTLHREFAVLARSTHSLPTPLQAVAHQSSEESPPDDHLHKLYPLPSLYKHVTLKHESEWSDVICKHIVLKTLEVNFVLYIT